MHVVMYHFLAMVPGFRAIAPGWLTNLLAAAPSEVTLFFILSGFVLAYNYLRPDGSMCVTKQDFWSARIARVYPVYVLGLLVYLPIAAARYFSDTGLSIVNVGPGPAFAISGILTLLLLQSWTIVFTAWNAPCWSVSSEAFFYFVFPWAAPRIMSWSRRRMLWSMTALWIGSLIGPAYFLIAILGHSSKSTKEVWEVALEIHPLLRIVPFLIGVATGVLFLRHRGEGAARYSIYASLLAAGALMIAAVVPAQNGRMFDNCITPVIAVILYLLAFGRGWFAKLMAHPAIVRLGEASYSIYILHNPLWNYVARMPNMLSVVVRGHFPVGLAKPGIATEWNYDMNGWVFCIYLVLLIGISLLSLRYVDRPARLYLRRYFTERQPRPAPAQVATSAS